MEIWRRCGYGCVRMKISSGKEKIMCGGKIWRRRRAQEMSDKGLEEMNAVVCGDDGDI